MEKSRFYYLRKAKGLTQTEMGNILELSEQQYARLEKGLVGIDVLKSIREAANYFGVTVDYLMGVGSELENDIASVVKQLSTDQQQWAYTTLKSFAEIFKGNEND